MVEYRSYYDRTILSHSTGFKLARGGTGLGKTKSIQHIVLAPEYHERKFIYCANRKQLLEEMAQSVDKVAPNSYVMLRRDPEVVLHTLKYHRDALYNLFEQPIFLENLKRWNEQNALQRIDLPAVKRACKLLEELLQWEETTRPQLLDTGMNMQASTILEAFKSVLLAANNKKGNSPSYQKLADNLVVQSLFPFLAFKRRPECRLLLVTLHKTYYGFFDGRRTLNLTRLHDEDGGYTIFLDEFDFLENELVKLICGSQQISNPFRFVELFYNAMTKNKLPNEEYPKSQSTRDRILEIKSLIDTLRNEGFPFPDINHFTSHLPQRTSHRPRKGGQEKKSPSIFRSQHIISTSSLYIQLTERSFHIVSEPDPANGPSYPALRLFDVVSHASNRILLLFKELERSDEDILHREIMRHCFQETLFPNQMALISQYLRSGFEQQTQLGTLLDSGYSLYDINDLQQRTDPDEVGVRHYGMHLTPEMILRSLAEHNLVFGLSATADIPRLVHNFDLNWLEHQITVIPFDETDADLIRTLNTQKAEARHNHVTTVAVSDLDANNPYQYSLDQFLSAVATDEDFGRETGIGHLKRRVQQFFASLLWMCDNAKEDSTLLLFLNTFRQIKLVFDRYQTQEESLFTITKRSGKSWFDVYEMGIQGHLFNVIFYNAQTANNVRQSEETQHSFNRLFWEKKPVIVVTQYLSAGIGVNLQYKPYEGCKDDKDFTHIGLLEAPYFYFSTPEEELTEGEKLAAFKENIWYQAKLFAGKAITEHRFRQVLSSLNASREWNNRYQLDPSTATDALLNHMSTFIQALGRVERIWTEMPDQTVLLSRDVYHRFQAFCSPEYDWIREQREGIISSNLQQIFAQVRAELPQVERAIRRSKDARLMAKDEQSREAIQRLLVRLEGLRQGNNDQEARRQWQDLRQVALKHDFGSDLLDDYGCVMESPYYAKGLLYLTQQNEIIPASLASYGTRPWNMNAVYDVISGNRVIREYFLRRGYELSFTTISRWFFTPYCFQAILVGAIGEEAISALLHDEDIPLEDLSDALFELADLKIQAKPWYIDCKNYNERTMEQFSVPADDQFQRLKLNDEYFIQNACNKVKKISAHHGEPGKLIYLILATSKEYSLDYYDSNFDKADSFTNAAIMVVQGVLDRYAPNKYRPPFEHFLHDLRSAEKGES